VERTWDTIRDTLQWPQYLSMVEYFWKIREKKHRTYIGNFYFVNRAIKNLNRLSPKAFGAYPCKLKIFRKTLKIEIINRVKRNEYKNSKIVSKCSDVK